MEMTNFQAALPSGWVYPDPDELESLIAEFRRELPPGHILHDHQIELIAARGGTDDILFRHLDEPGRLTVIHLSWLGREEIDAQHPWVEYDGDAAGFWAWEQSQHSGSYHGHRTTT